jgi:HK97 family phage major capsid protein
MWEEILKDASVLLTSGLKLQSVSKIGTGDEKDLIAYMEEREKFLFDVTKFLTDMPSSLEKVFVSINEELKKLKKDITSNRQPEKELTKLDVAKAITRAALFSVNGIEAFRSEQAVKDLSNIIIGKSFMNDGNDVERRVFHKDAVATDLAPGGTNAGYTINPIYEKELIKYLPEYSDMAGYTRVLPMFAPQHSWPMLAARSFVMTRTAATSSGTTWSAASKIADKATGPSFAARITLTATTLAAYIPWIDEFVDDLQIDESLANLMLECVVEAMAEDYDFNVLTANADTSGVEYDGLLHTDGVLEHYVSSPVLQGVMPDELKTALLKIARTERDGGYWILHETVLDQLSKVRDAMGSYLFWTPPSGDNPGKLAGRPYIEAHLMPDSDEIKPGDVFMAYAKPENLWVGQRAGLEVRQFDATTYNLEYAQVFTRWRKRDAYRVVKPEAALLVKLHS